MIAAALEEIDLSAALAAHREQTDRYGHTAESDALLPIDHFAAAIVSRSHEAGDVMRAGDRQNLEVAYRRLARLAALALSSMARIRREQSEQRSTDQ